MNTMPLLEELDGGREPRLEELLGTMAKILAEDAAGPVRVVDGRVVEGRDVYWALRLMGARRAPVGRRARLEELGFYDDIDPPRLRVYRDTLELLYRSWPTPLVRLRSLSGSWGEAWAKLEWYNPYSMSVKDRIGWYMVKRLVEERGVPERIVEATSTNTGMALAAMGAIYGFGVRLYIPRTIQRASDILLWALGAEVVRTEKQLTVELLEEVSRDATVQGAVHVNQFGNDANFLVHLRYTAKELELQLRSLEAEPQAILGGLGTSGHMSAIAFYFKNRLRGKVRVYGVQPAPGEVIPGIRRVETGMKWLEWVELDSVVEVTRREAVEALLEVARRDGILPGLSSGAVAAAYKRLVGEGVLEPGVHVLVFPDNGFKYVEQLSEHMRGQEG